MSERVQEAPSLSPATVARHQQAHAVAEPQAPLRRSGPSGGKVINGEAPASARLLNRRCGRSSCRHLAEGDAGQFQVVHGLHEPRRTDNHRGEIAYAEEVEVGGQGGSVQDGDFW